MFCHRLERITPAGSGLFDTADDQPVILDIELDIALDAELLDQRLRYADTPRISYLYDLCLNDIITICDYIVITYGNTVKRGSY